MDEAFPQQWEGSKLPKGPHQSSNGYSNRVHLLSISPEFPRVRGKPAHVSSQGKEAICATHDIYNQDSVDDESFVIREIMPLLEKYDLSFATENNFTSGQDRFTSLQRDK